VSNLEVESESFDTRWYLSSRDRVRVRVRVSRLWVPKFQ
jgi:hypothetical protein